MVLMLEWKILTPQRFNAVYLQSDEFARCAKLSEALKGKEHSADHRTKTSEAKKGMKRSAET